MIKIVADYFGISNQEAYDLLKQIIKTGDQKALGRFFRSLK